MPIVTLTDICKSFGPEVVLSGLSQRFYPGEKVGLIGANGSGKTTVLRLILGSCEPDIGKIIKRKGLRIGYLPQEASFKGNSTVLEEMHSGLEGVLSIQKKMQALAERLGGLRDSELNAAMAEYERLSRQFELAGGYEYEIKVQTILAGLGLEELYDTKTSSLSGGQLSRLGLAKTLLYKPDLLLLDEPTNHLDLQATVWLEKFLKNYDGAAVVISHDRYLLDSVSCKIVEIESKKTVTWKGSYSRYLANKQKAMLRQQRQYEKRAEFVEKTRDFVARNKDKEGMRKTARGRKKRLEKLLLNEPEFLSKRAEQKAIGFSFAKAKSRSDLILRSENLGKSFGSLRLFEGLTFDILAGQRFGITGPNGTGKSTLLKMALGKIKPTEGSVKMGVNISIGYLDQHARTLDPENTVLQEVSAARPDFSEEALRTRLGTFLFRGDDVFKKARQLSGGQQNRLMLCKLVLTEPDVLVLDEPTNHLDIESREALEEGLREYAGTIITVSHDRYFLDRVVDNLLVIGTGLLGGKKMGAFEFVGGGDGVYSRYARLIEKRQAENNKQQAKERGAKKPKRAKPSGSKLKNTTPKELRKFNRLTTEEIEADILGLEELLTRLQEEFGDEKTYKNPALLAQLRAKFDDTQAELDLLYQVYGFRNG